MMNIANEEDVKDMAVKLDDIFIKSPADYYYIKGFIHCLWRKETNDETSATQEKALQPAI